MSSDIEELTKLKVENTELKAENEKLKEATDGLLNIQYTLADSCKKYSKTLQEIKAIVCGNYEIIDPQGRKDILKLITKAEEE